MHKFLCDHMKDAQDSMSRCANQNHMVPPPLCIGDCVFVCTDHIQMNQTAHKLAEKKIGLFPIISQPSAMFYTLHLPGTIRIHPVFHVLQLEPEFPNTFED